MQPPQPPAPVSLVLLELDPAKLILLKICCPPSRNVQCLQTPVGRRPGGHGTSLEGSQGLALWPNGFLDKESMRRMDLPTCPWSILHLLPYNYHLGNNPRECPWEVFPDCRPQPAPGAEPHGSSPRRSGHFTIIRWGPLRTTCEHWRGLKLG